MSNKYTFTITEEKGRIDKFLSEQLEELSRSQIQNLIEQGEVTVNDQVIKSNYKLLPEDEVKIIVPEAKPLELIPEDISFDVLYEDDAIAIVNKPQGLVVHPAPGHHRGTLVNGLLKRFGRLSDVNGEFRPGIVHRLDKDTSGALVIAKTNDAHKKIAEQFQARTPYRQYVALVHGEIEHEIGTINVPIGRDPHNRQKFAGVKDGKEAITHFKVRRRFEDYTLVEARLETGRTHQIRVHFSYIGHPVVGDTLYGSNEVSGDQGHFLHAEKLGFDHPVSGKYVEFSAPLPDAFIEKIETSH